MLSVIRNEFGFEKLRNADVLEFGANRQPFCPFLKKKFGTKAVSSNGHSQDINHLFPNKRFDLIIGNKVFEREAFEHKTGQSDDALEEPIDEFLKQMPRKLLRKERAWVRGERTAILKRFADHLKPGGKIIATAISSKTIFHPDEISKAGLKISRLNAPLYGPLIVTVLYKPK